MPEVIRWGIIGCGNVCEVKSGPAFAKADGSALTVVMRRDGAKAKDYAERHGVGRWTDDAQQVIAADDVDAVYIATPVDSHLEHALAVAAAGKPCYVEKPMARSHAECREMVDAFESAGVPLFVAYYRRGLPRFVEAKRLIDAGHVGTIVGVRLRFTDPRHRHIDPTDLPWRVQAASSGGGYFFDLGSHMLDAIDYLVGPIAEASGEALNLASPHAVEDTVAMRFRLENGAPGLGYWCFAADQHDDRIVIDGTDGQLELSAFGGGTLIVRTASDVRRLDLPDPAHVQQPLIQHIVDELRGKGRSPSTGRSAARTAAVMDAVTEAYYGGRDDAFWERPDSWPGRRQG